MFPTADERGRVRGFGARAMREDQRPKYLNTSDSELYHKREVLYGIDLARMRAAKAGRIVLVEGYTDVLALHQAGVRNAAGIMGTSLTREQVARLVRLVGVLELCLDADRAGEEAMVRAAELAAASKLELRVVPLPPGADPGDLIAREGAEALRERIERSVPFVVFAVERVLERADLTSAEGKDRAIAQLRPLLEPVPASVAARRACAADRRRARALRGAALRPARRRCRRRRRRRCGRRPPGRFALCRRAERWHLARPGRHAGAGGTGARPGGPRRALVPGSLHRAP